MTANAEEQVRAVEAAYDRAWGAGDLDGLLRCLAPDAVLVNPRGEIAIGTDAIRAALGGFLATEAAGSHHTSSVERISFIGDDVAVVDGRAVISPGPGDVHQATLEHAFTHILQHRDGTWQIAHIRAYGLTPHTRVRQ